MPQKKLSPKGGPSKAAQALAMGYRFVRAVELGEVQDFAALAVKLKVSRAWVSMAVELTFLAPRIQEDVLFGDRRQAPIQELVRLARLGGWAEQVERWKGRNTPQGHQPPALE